MKKVLRTTLAICLMLCMTLAFAGCGQNFDCSGKTFAYDGYETEAELDDAQRLMIEGMALASYGDTQFKFHTNGSFFWKHNDSTDFILSGNWQVSGNTVVLTDPDDGSELETLHIVGAGFYVNQPVSETLTIRLYFAVE